jgi:hypothetical protein
MNERDSSPNSGSIPRGIEVLLKKASVDPAFKALLLAQREEAARLIDLALTPNERLILQSAPVDQLTAMIDRTKVPQEHRRVFLGHAAAAMLAALGIVALQPGCGPAGTRPNLPPQQGSKQDLPPQPDSTSRENPVIIAGTRSDVPNK